MAALTGAGLVAFAQSKLGTPYFYGSKIQYGALTEKFMEQMHNAYPSTVTASYMQKARNKGMVGKVCVDCSGLIYGYTGKAYGSSQLYSNASRRLSTSSYKDWENGTVCWRSGHVGIFSKENGKYYVYEAKGINYGTVKSTFVASKWSYGLQFSWMSYDSITVAPKVSSNPYVEPTKAVKKGCTGTDVKWVQYELIEAGYGQKFKYNGTTYNPVVIDGSAGRITDAAIRAFQASCKIDADGSCGATTRKYLKAN